MSNKKSLYEIIESWFLSGHTNIEDKLKDEEYRIFLRWRYANTLMTQRRPVITTSEVVRCIIRDFGVSERTAEQDIFFAKKLYGEARKINKDWEVPFYIEWLKQTASLAEAAGDYRSAVAAIKEVAKLVLILADSNDQGTANVPTTLNIQFMLPNSESKVISIDSFQKLGDKEFLNTAMAINSGGTNSEKMEKLLNRYHGDNNEQSTED